MYSFLLSNERSTMKTQVNNALVWRMRCDAINVSNQNTL